MKNVYKSGISYWLFGILILVFSTITVLLILDNAPWFALLLIIAVFIFVIQLFINTYYVIDKESLKIKSGFLYNAIIDIHSIRKIEESNSPLSSPAASFDRLEIIYNKYDSILISPKDKHSFIQDILKINPTIEIKYRK